jgi:microcin C transport system substrate-binding protein
MARQSSVGAALASWLMIVAPTASASDDLARRNAMSLIGTPRHASDLKHFDWVNPDAPKGGHVRGWALGTFDSLNPFPAMGNPANEIGLIYDSLMSPSPDEASTEYGLIAEWVAYPGDFSSATFGLRPDARFHDGKPVTTDDVIFSLDAIKKASPNYAFYYKNVIKAEKTEGNHVTFFFNVKGNRELPMIAGELPILPKHYWEETNTNGEPRDLTKSSLEVPLGSGPYRIKEVDAGRSIAYERVKNWWAKDLPVAKGQWNFDEIRIVYFRDWVAAFEAFKAKELDYWPEHSAKSWALAYDFDAVKRGWVKREQFPVSTVAPMQAFAFNIRRPQFQDPRVRRAFNLAFDFEWANKSLFYGQYARVGSYFDNSELKAVGLPNGRELEMLNDLKNEVPAQVFTTEWKNPVNATTEDARRHLGEAAKLLAEAGWTPKDGILTNSQGAQFAATFLLLEPDFQRIALPYIEVLKKLGIMASARIVDSSQYRGRLATFDFDIIVASFPQSGSPGNEQRDFWGSEAAGRAGSLNVIGVKNPAIDKLIDTIIHAKDRNELVAATQALDRVLLWSNYVVPQWYTPFERLAFWDIYGRPDRLPSRSSSFLRVWWWDSEAAKRLSDARD